MPELYDRTATELAALIASGTVSSREVLDAHIDRVEAVQPVLNAVTWRLYDEARELAARADEAVARGAELGPLHGVPMSIKEQFLVRGTPSTWGRPSRAGHRATTEGPLLRRLRAAGAVPFVRTNVPVMLLETETHNPLYGRTNNPWDPARTSGGSSGGEGALLAARGSPLGMGADIGGSLRVPAHYCGIATIKATANRLPGGDNPPDFPAWQEAIVDVKGPMARTVADVALGYRVLATGHDDLPREPEVPPVPHRDPREVTVRGLRVGMVDADGGVPVAPAVRRAVHRAADVLADAGAVVERFDPPSGEEVYALYIGLLGGDGFRHVVDQLGDDPKSPVLQLLAGAGKVPRPVARRGARLVAALGQRDLAPVVAAMGSRSFAEYGDLLVARRAMTDRLAATFHDRFDVLLYPPHALPALPHGRFRDVSYASTTTFLANLTGLPAGIVPVTRVRPDEETHRRPGVDVTERLLRDAERGSVGLPVGVQVLAPWWREDVVLAAMATIEGGVEPMPMPPWPRPEVETT